MKEQNRKILIIVYYWPPSGGSGVQRWMYFARYLSDLGYTPVILTVSPEKASYKDWDQSNCDMVKGIETHTTNTFELIKLYSLFTSGSTTKGIPQGHVGAKKHGSFGKISSFIRGNLFIPDARIGWKFYATKKAKEIIRKENIKLILTSGPPHSTHLIGNALKKKTGINWIADFRDPWTEIYYNLELPRLNWAKKLDAKLEKQVLENADMVLTIGPSLLNLLSAKVPGQKDKFHYILNGYDDEAMRQISFEPDELFKITFIGQFALAQPHEAMIEALGWFFEKHQSEAHKFRICLAGTMDELIVSKFQKFPGIRVDYMGRIPHLDALQLMKNSQLLLNSLAEVESSKILISGKLMEYISTGNPILCIGDPEGDAAALLHPLDNSKMCTKDDVEGILEFTSLVYDRWKSGKPLIQGNKDYMRYSRYETARQLAGLINNNFSHV